TSAITTSGAQTYNDAVTLGAATVLTATSSGAVTFNSTVDGAFGLTINTAGSTHFDKQVGSITALSSLTTNAGGITSIRTILVQTSGNQTYNDTVTLQADPTLGNPV